MAERQTIFLFAHYLPVCLKRQIWLHAVLNFVCCTDLCKKITAIYSQLDNESSSSFFVERWKYKYCQVNHNIKCTILVIKIISHKLSLFKLLTLFFKLTHTHTREQYYVHECIPPGTQLTIMYE